MTVHKVYRSAVTGEWVSAEYAEANPETTVSETIDAPTFQDPSPADLDDGDFAHDLRDENQALADATDALTETMRQLGHLDETDA